MADRIRSQIGFKKSKLVETSAQSPTSEISEAPRSDAFCGFFVSSASRFGALGCLNAVVGSMDVID